MVALALGCYRFSLKLREHGDMLAACTGQVLATLHGTNPGMGKTVAIKGSDLPPTRWPGDVKRGGELRKRFADPDASCGPPVVNFHPQR
jgi:hypothetical protein